MYDAIVRYINFFKAHHAKSGNRSLAVPAFQEVSMEKVNLTWVKRSKKEKPHSLPSRADHNAIHSTPV